MFRPPATTLLRRPHLSAKMVAGIVATRMTMLDTDGRKTSRSNTEVDFHSPPHPVQSKPRSEAFEVLHLPIRYRVPRGVSRLVTPIKDVTDDATGSRCDTEAHQQIQTYPFSQGDLDSSKYEYWISR